MVPKPVIKSWAGSYSNIPNQPFLRVSNSSDTADSDRETDSGHAGSSIGESDDTVSCAGSSFSTGEVRSDQSTEESRKGGYEYEYDHLLKFCCRELQPCEEDGFDACADQFTILQRSRVTSPIVSRTGSIRGVCGRVRAACKAYKDSSVGSSKNFEMLERGKIVLYVTSLAVCRGPFLKCLEIRKILHNLMIKYSECDLYLNRSYQRDLRERIGAEKAESVPHLFIEGHYVGDYDAILDLNESGQLRSMLKPYKRYGIEPPCEQCGGFTVVPCTVCSGSKKSNHRNAFTDQFYALRCSSCDANGLQQCRLCVGQTIC